MKTAEICSLKLLLESVVSISMSARYYKNGMMLKGIVIGFSLLSLMLSSPPALSGDQDSSRKGVLGLELNAVEKADEGCRLTFLLKNDLEAALSALRFELALFDPEGRVTTVIVLDAGSLPQGKTRVKRFNLSGVQCPDVSRILLNDITECQGETFTAAKCLSRVDISSRGDVEFSL